MYRVIGEKNFGFVRWSLQFMAILILVGWSATLNKPGKSDDHRWNPIFFLMTLYSSYGLTLELEGPHFSSILNRSKTMLYHSVRNECKKWEIFTPVQIANWSLIMLRTKILGIELEKLRFTWLLEKVTYQSVNWFLTMFRTKILTWKWLDGHHFIMLLYVDTLKFVNWF